MKKLKESDIAIYPKINWSIINGITSTVKLTSIVRYNRKLIWYLRVCETTDEVQSTEDLIKVVNNFHSACYNIRLFAEPHEMSDEVDDNQQDEFERIVISEITNKS